MTVDAIVRPPSSSSKMTTNNVIRRARLRVRGRGNSYRAMGCGDYATEGVASERAEFAVSARPRRRKNEPGSPDGITVTKEMSSVLTFVLSSRILTYVT